MLLSPVDSAIVLHRLPCCSPPIVALALPLLSGRSFGVEIHRNRLLVRGESEAFRYTIVSVNGSRKFSGVFRKELDLSALPVGMYGIKVKSSSGVTNIIRFVRK